MSSTPDPLPDLIHLFDSRIRDIPHPTLIQTLPARRSIRSIRFTRSIRSVRSYAAYLAARLQVEGDVKRVLAERRTLVDKFQKIEVVEQAVKDLYIQMKVGAGMYVHGEGNPHRSYECG